MSNLRGSPSPRPAETDIPASASAVETEWREYQLLVEVYKFYLDLAVKFVAAYFAICGAIVTLVLANFSADRIVANALWVPFLMSLLVAVGTWMATPKAKETQRDIRRLRTKLHLDSTVHVELLVWIVTWFPVLSLGVALL